MNLFKDFFSQLISVNESRKSVVVLILIIISSFGLYIATSTNDIPDNISTIILTLCGFIWGLNTVKGITDMIIKKNSLNKAQDASRSNETDKTDEIDNAISDEIRLKNQESNIDSSDEDNYV